MENSNISYPEVFFLGSSYTVKFTESSASVDTVMTDSSAGQTVRVPGPFITPFLPVFPHTLAPQGIHYTKLFDFISIMKNMKKRINCGSRKSVYQ